MADDDFEGRLKAELPRGLAPQKPVGRERAFRTLAHRRGNDRRNLGIWPKATVARPPQGRLIGWNDDRHVLTIAGSRAGKGVSLIMPNLLFYEGSALVIDPKGENAAITAGRRGKGTKTAAGLGQDVYVLDPFGVSGPRTRRAPVSFNPMAELDLDDDDVIEDAGMFAEALIKHPKRTPLDGVGTSAVARADPGGARRSEIRGGAISSPCGVLMLTDPRIKKVQDTLSPNSNIRSRGNRP